jgi:hypothetical protein
VTSRAGVRSAGPLLFTPERFEGLHGLICVGT